MTKRRLIIGLLILAVFLFACTAQEPSGDDSSTPSSQQTVQVDTGQESDTIIKPIESTPTQTTSTKQITAEVREILEANYKIKSVQYIRDEGKDPQTFYLRGDRYKKEVPRPSRYSDPSENYDMVYVYRDEQKAYGYCEDSSSVACPLDYRDQAYPLDFEAEDEFLPLDLLPTITYAEIVGNEDIDDRHVNVLEFTNKDNQNGKVWMDSYYGFVFQYQLFDDNGQVVEEHSYTRAAFNKVSEDDVSLPEGVQIIE